MICSWFSCNEDAECEIIEVDEGGVCVTNKGLPLCAHHLYMIGHNMYMVVPAKRGNMFL